MQLLMMGRPSHKAYVLILLLAETKEQLWTFFWWKEKALDKLTKQLFSKY